jgi:hypothetical protein
MLADKHEESGASYDTSSTLHCRQKIPKGSGEFRSPFLLALQEITHNH